jgi:hypothetical protein
VLLNQEGRDKEVKNPWREQEVWIMHWEVDLQHLEDLGENATMIL